MALPKPLKLRAEKIAAKRRRSTSFPIAHVLVRTPVFHLADEYEYEIPLELEEVLPGTLLKVPFGNVFAEAVLLRRVEAATIGGKLKMIASVLSSGPVLTSQQLEMLDKVSTSFGVKKWELIDAFLPKPTSRLPKIHRIRNSEEPTSEIGTLPASVMRRLSSHALLRDLLVLAPLEPDYSTLVQIATVRSSQGKVVIVFPDLKDLEHIRKLFLENGIEPVILHSQLTKSERFMGYLEANAMKRGVVLGLRSSVFLHLESTDTLIIFNEADQSHYEQRSPTWNTRDIALNFRSTDSTIFITSAPSLELYQAVSEDRLTIYHFPVHKQNSITFQRHNQDDFQGLIRKNLKTGSVLICVASTGERTSFICATCKNIASCQCGGRLHESKEHQIDCVICQKIYSQWNCQFCKSALRTRLGRGAALLAANLGKVFPGTRVLTSGGEEQQHLLPEGRSLVISTYGSEPIGEYSCVILLDCEQQYSRVELRAQERARLHWMTALSRLNVDGDAHISLPAAHPFSRAIKSGKITTLLESEISERSEVHLPPDFRVIVIASDFATISSMQILLNSHDFELLGPRALKKETFELIVKVPHVQDGRIAYLTELLRSANRVRSLKSLPLIGVRFDPYDI